MEMSKVGCYVLDDRTFVSSQHGKAKSVVGLIGIRLLRTLVWNFHFICGIHQPGNFYWASSVGERNADSWFPCPSPYWDNRWSPRVIRIEDCLWGWAFYWWSRNPEPPEEAGRRGHPVEGGKNERMIGESITANWKCYYHQGCKIQGSLSLGHKIRCHV